MFYIYTMKLALCTLTTVGEFLLLFHIEIVNVPVLFRIQICAPVFVLSMSLSIPLSLSLSLSVSLSPPFYLKHKNMLQQIYRCLENVRDFLLSIILYI
jgi:hypothetical protein